MAGGDYPSGPGRAACYHLRVDSPYREPPSATPAVAPSRDGPVRVEVGAHGVRVDLGARYRLSVSGGRAVWSRTGRGRRRTLSLGRARLWVTRTHPTRELSLSGTKATRDGSSGWARSARCRCSTPARW